MKTVAIVQARMTSSRLPGKVLASVAGRPMLEQQLRRLAKAEMVNQVVVATTDQSTDDPVRRLAHSLGHGVFRGSETDVLGRFAGAATRSRADVVVRITADCPLLDPQIVDRVVHALVSDPNCDYVSNVSPRTHPQGLDVEAFRASVLHRIAGEATSQMAREHVTWYIAREKRALFNTYSVTEPDDHSELRWTVDTAEDLALIRRLYEELELDTNQLGYREILAHVLATPVLRTINQHIPQRHEPRPVQPELRSENP